MRVIVAERDPDVRWALRCLLSDELAMQVAGETADAADLLPLVEETSPDLLVLEWELLRAEPRTALARLRARSPALHIIVLSRQAGTCRQALTAGADAAASKGDPPEQLLQALRALRVHSDADRADAGTQHEGPYD
jgi:DNA-binding NarL/FixJ family response regulator